jgi:hypothetical protein
MRSLNGAVITPCVSIPPMNNAQAMPSSSNRGRSLM